MPEYLSPGVYMEEFEIGARPIEGVSTSTAGFLGETERGPTTPRLVTSWLQFQRIYGGYFGNDKYLPGAVDGFFKNGGGRCYIARIVKSKTESASQAELNLKLTLSNDLKIPIGEDIVLKIKAVGEGEWGNRIALKLSSTPLKGTPLKDRIRLDVIYWKKNCPSETDIKNADDDIKISKFLKEHPPSVSETFDNISINETSSDFIDNTVNGISNLIEIKIETSTTADSSLQVPSENPVYLLLKKGSDGPKNPDAVMASLNLQHIDKTGLTDFAGILKITALNSGKEGNNIGIKLGKRSEGGLKLEVYPDKTNKEGQEQFEGESSKDLLSKVNDPTSGSKLIKISTEDNKYKEVTGPITDPVGLETLSNPANLMLQSIQVIDYDELNEYKGKILIITALNAGEDGKKIGITLGKGSECGLKLEVYPDKTNKEGQEQFEGESSEDLLNKVNDPTSGSKLIKISIEDNEYKEAKKLLKNIISLEGGKDSEKAPTVGIYDYLRNEGDDLTPGNRRGLTALEEIEDISIIYSPCAYNVPGLVSNLIDHCENLRYRFAILDAPNDPAYSNFDPRSNKPDEFRPTDHAAFYCPWIKVINPETGLLQDMPPGGYIAGIYARSDTERGVHKAPANEIVKGASDLKFRIVKGEQDILNPRGVNVIRAFSGRGILVWGARTLSSNTLWKYINVRRLFIYIEASIEKGTQWVVFEPNNERLWGRVKATITQFLTGVWRSGALMGTKPEEAFFVKCDRNTMTQDDIDNGRLICIIGIAPVKPAEFVIFRIAQWAGGSASTE